MPNELIITTPRHMKITSRQEAADAILYMCRDCNKHESCTGAMSAQCNEVKQQIKTFAEQLPKEEPKETGVCYDRVVISSQPSTRENSLHGCEPVYILSAVDITEKSEEDLKNEFEIMKILHPIWKDRKYETFLTWKADMYETKFMVDTYDTAYFLNPVTAQQYARQNMADINEAGCYPYLVIYSRPTNHMYAEANPCFFELYHYDHEKDEYLLIEDIKSDIRYEYIRNAFDSFYRPPKEEIISES